MKWAGIFFPIIFAIIAFMWIPLDLWIDMNQGLLAFLGLLSAAIIQIIPVTANFLQSDHLTPEEARQLSGQLSKQQRYWLGLLASAVATVALVVIISVLKNHTHFDIASYQFDFDAPLSALIAFAVSFVLIKMAGIFQGVISLQKLRSELVMNAAKRSAADQIKHIQAGIEIRQEIVPENYGKIVRPH
jgi:hypothetical protein